MSENRTAFRELYCFVTCRCTFSNSFPPKWILCSSSQCMNYSMSNASVFKVQWRASSCKGPRVEENSEFQHCWNKTRTGGDMISAHSWPPPAHVPLVPAVITTHAPARLPRPSQDANSQVPQQRVDWRTLLDSSLERMLNKRPPILTVTDLQKKNRGPRNYDTSTTGQYAGEIWKQ